MSKFIHASLLLAGLAGLAAAAQSPTPEIKSVKLHQTSATSGQEMYSNYCASCHGANATGNGPVAPALTSRPADLTLLRQKNGGVFPTDHVMSVLKLGVVNPAHGSSQMPVWGDQLTSLYRPSTDSSGLVNLRIINLTHYLEQVQK
jgi:mono/diheme cytochrome c family protein